MSLDGRHRARHAASAQGIELAERARGQTSPNPLVGAVVVKGGRVIGEGITQPPGEAHAERAALDACSEDPAGATLYVSLEPCGHQGRTPPCTEAILEAAIARVVVASDDPTPKASGRGPGILRDEGVDVVWVDGEVAARRAAAQPALPQARPHRAPARRLQVGDDARRQGRHRHRRLAVDLRRGEPRPRAPLARRVGRRGRRDRHRARPTTRSSPPASRAWRASRAGSCSTPRRACRSTRSSSRASPRSRSPWSARAPPRAPPCRRSSPPGVDVIVATGQNERARVERRARRAGRARGPVAAARGRARTSPARSSRPARSTRRACSSRR